MAQTWYSQHDDHNYNLTAGQYDVFITPKEWLPNNKKDYTFRVYAANKFEVRRIENSG